jgi:uncharacterized membrane protein YgcG
MTVKYTTTNHRTIATVAIIIAALALVMASTIIIVTPAPAFALKRFYNCMTDIVNKSGKLTIDDITICYDKEYHTGPYFTHSSSHSTGGGSSRSSTASSSTSSSSSG